MDIEKCFVVKNFGIILSSHCFCLLSARPLLITFVIT
jgi:hypothetical protein